LTTWAKQILVDFRSQKCCSKKGLLDSGISVEKEKLFWLEYSELDECG
jgi:hypothetical protein